MHLNKKSATYLLSVLNENDATFLIIKCVSNVVFYIKKGPTTLKRTRQMFYQSYKEKRESFVYILCFIAAFNTLSFLTSEQTLKQNIPVVKYSKLYLVFSLISKATKNNKKE